MQILAKSAIVAMYGYPIQQRLMMKSLAVYSDFLEIGVGKEYHQKRLNDFRSLSALMFILGSFFAAGLWEWDYITDPIGASDTLYLRLLYCPLYLAIGFAFRRVQSYRAMALIAVGGVLFSELLLVLIFNRLDTGMTYGIGGFMFYPLISFIGFQGFSIRVTALYSVLYAAIPHLLAVTHVAIGFQHVHYAVLIWPAAFLTVLGHLAATQSYRQRYESELALQRASNTDAMTGVANRRSFIPLIHQEMLRCQRFERPLSLMMLDIDHFKSINDTYGHPTGDNVICKLAEVCCMESRQIDKVARLGGEEFAILLPETDLSFALAVAERIRLAVEALAMRSIDNREFRFTVSIGVAEYQTDNASIEQLLSAADAALYRAKNAGRNQVVAAS